MSAARRLNTLSDDEAREVLASCCGAGRWAERMNDRRPFEDDQTLFATADRVWGELGEADWREAFAAHPRIGEQRLEGWSRTEQSGVAGSDPRTLARLREANVSYERRFGHVFLICAAGRNAEEMLAELERRSDHDPETELRIAAEEQAKITRLRLERLANE